MIDWDGQLGRHGQDDWKMARPYAEETCTVIMLSPSKRNMTRNMGRTFLLRRSSLFFREPIIM